MNQFNLTTTKTARIFSIGELTHHTKNIWIVLHGYAYHAKYFLKKFECLQNKETIVFAPEALNRFYKDGLTGKVGASWMTKEDRQNEIKDYINYLDKFYELILTKIKPVSNVKINVLGFSQGVSTMCRWLANKKSKANNIIIWANTLPHDFNFDTDIDVFYNANNFVVYGLQDQFLKKELAEQFKTKLKKLDIKYKLFTFDGKHEINESVLKKIDLQIS